MTLIRAEAGGDAAAIEELLSTLFGPGRFAKSAYRLREGVKPVSGLSFVAAQDVSIVGTIRYWPVHVGRVPVLLLGPIAVQRSLQGQGIAVSLMTQSLNKAKADGHACVVLVGDESYYGRVGFKRIEPIGRISMPGPVDPSRILGLDLTAGALSALNGAMTKASIDDPVCAAGASLTALAVPAE